MEPHGSGITEMTGEPSAKKSGRVLKRFQGDAWHRDLPAGKVPWPTTLPIRRQRSPYPQTRCGSMRHCCVDADDLNRLADGCIPDCSVCATGRNSRCCGSWRRYRVREAESEKRSGGNKTILPQLPNADMPWLADRRCGISVPAPPRPVQWPRTALDAHGAAPLVEGQRCRQPDIKLANQKSCQRASLSRRPMSVALNPLLTRTIREASSISFGRTSVFSFPDAIHVSFAFTKGKEIDPRHLFSKSAFVELQGDGLEFGALTLTEF